MPTANEQVPLSRHNNVCVRTSFNSVASNVECSWRRGDEVGGKTDEWFDGRMGRRRREY
jgi:hypothetical protein